MSIPEFTYNSTDAILKYTVLQEMRAAGYAFDASGESRSLNTTLLNQTTLQTISAGMQKVQIENNGDVTISVEYTDNEERNFEIEAGGSAVVMAESYNGLPEIKVLPGSVTGKQVNSITIQMFRFI